MKNPIKLEVPDVQQHLLLSLLGEKKKKKVYKHGRDENISSLKHMNSAHMTTSKEITGNVKSTVQCHTFTDVLR